MSASGGETSNVAVRDSDVIETQETPENPEGEEEMEDEDYNPDEEEEQGSSEEESSEEEENLEEGTTGETSGIGNPLQELSEESSVKESMVGSPGQQDQKEKESTPKSRRGMKRWKRVENQYRRKEHPLERT